MAVSPFMLKASRSTPAFATSVRAASDSSSNAGELTDADPG
jgi:hypothetical protein